MAYGLTLLPSTLAADATILVLGAALDLVLGDPVYPFHPVRLMGKMLSGLERLLRKIGFDGYGGGVLLFVGLAGISLVVTCGLVVGAQSWSPRASWVLHLFLVYSFLALGDLLRHVWRIESAARRHDLDAARMAVGALVGRDIEKMDLAACRRAAVESLGENLTDGFVSAVFWYVLLGLPGLVLFKVVSTMDSMVGYKTPEYLRFGWCGARLDDVMNFVPARLTWALITLTAVALPSFSGRKAWRVGLSQHARLPGPNAGWSEVATAGALGRRLAGPIWLAGVQVTDLWIGDPSDPPLDSGRDVVRAMALAVLVGVVATAMGSLLREMGT